MKIKNPLAITKFVVYYFVVNTILYDGSIRMGVTHAL